MKTTFAALALATASGHMCNHETHTCTLNWKVLAIDAIYKPLTGAHIQDMCEEKPEKMHMGLFWRKFFRETHVTGVEALYGETGFINDECFGEWMIPAWAPVHKVIDTIKNDDMYNVTYEDWQGAGQALLDMAWKNEDACQFRKIGDDIKNWCLGAEGTCFRLDGVFERVFENFFPMIWNYVDMFKLLKTNDICYSDEQLIDEYATMYGDFCKNVVIVHGMQPLSWNNGLQQAHVNQHEFHEEKKAYKAAHASIGKQLINTVINLVK